MLEYLAERPRVRSVLHTLTLDRITEAFRIGHHFMCASAKQRDMWLGAMLAERLIRPEALRPRPEPALDHRRRPVRSTTRTGREDRRRGPATAVRPSARRRDRVLERRDLAAGSTRRPPIRATADLVTRRPSAHLVFMGAASHAPPRPRPTRRALSHPSSACSARTCTSTTSGSRTAPAPTGCSRATAPSRPTSSTSRPASRSGRASSTASGQDCPIVCTQRRRTGASAVERDDLGGTAPQGDAAALADAARQGPRARAAPPTPSRWRAPRPTTPGPRPPSRWSSWITSPQLPPRLGDGIGGGLSRRPLAVARHHGTAPAARP